MFRCALPFTLCRLICAWIEACLDGLNCHRIIVRSVELSPLLQGKGSKRCAGCRVFLSPFIGGVRHYLNTLVCGNRDITFASDVVQTEIGLDRRDMFLTFLSYKSALQEVVVRDSLVLVIVAGCRIKGIGIDREGFFNRELALCRLFVSNKSQTIDGGRVDAIRILLSVRKGCRGVDDELGELVITVVGSHQSNLQPIASADVRIRSKQQRVSSAFDIKRLRNIITDSSTFSREFIGFLGINRRPVFQFKVRKETRSREVPSSAVLKIDREVHHISCESSVSSSQTISGLDLRLAFPNGLSVALALGQLSVQRQCDRAFGRSQGIGVTAFL